MGAILVSKNPETGRRVEIAYEIFYLTTEVLPKSNWKTLRLVSREPNEFAFGLPFSDNYVLGPMHRAMRLFNAFPCIHGGRRRFERSFTT
jgi:hypothetical protein